MDDQMECMCLQCGVSTYLYLSQISLEDVADSPMKMVINSFCPACGGSLAMIGRAGDEPHYRLKE
jgi:hypothetical protein